MYPDVAVDGLECMLVWRSSASNVCQWWMHCYICRFGDECPGVTADVTVGGL